MNDQAHISDVEKTAEEPSEDLRLELNFVPEWARTPPKSNYFNYEAGGERTRERRYGNRPEQKRSPNKERRPAARPKKEETRSSKPRPAYSPRPERQPYREEPKRIDIPPISVRFIPLPRAISEIARKIQSTRRAYPIMQVASLYLANPESCTVRVEIEKNKENLQILQCKICGMIALDENVLYRHMVKSHLDAFMDKKTEQGEMPTGKFSCVAQCGFSGTLLGPPNHHSYAEKIQELHSSSYSNMTLEAYTSRIKTIHGEEAVEKWKQAYSNQISYQPKNSETGKPMSQVKAEAYFLKNIAPAHLQKTKRASLPAPLCRSIEDKGLQLAVKNAWMDEYRYPASIMMALRGAFTSKGLIIFKAGKGRGLFFVSTIPLVPIKLDHVVDAIREVMIHLQEHPGSSRAQLVKALRPTAEPDSEEIKEIISPLSWLIDRGHIIEFFDGTLAVPLGKK